MACFTFIKRKARLAIAILSLAMIFDAQQSSDAMARKHSSASTRNNIHIADLIAEAAQRFGIPQSWIHAVMGVESAGDRRAVSPKGAMGLMQIMPKTYADLRISYGLGRDPFDPHDNILAGAAYLREMHDRYGSPGFLAAYNAGPERYEDHLTTGRPLPSETRVYVRTLASRLGLEQENGDATIDVAALNAARWNQGPLFFVREIVEQLTPKPIVQTADRPSSGMHIKHSVSARSAVDVTALVPQQRGLFVRRMASEMRP
jgi:soluble lytic murein transglycosylase-like protein